TSGLIRKRKIRRNALAQLPIETLESRMLLSGSVVSFGPPSPVTIASDDAQSYTTWDYGSNGGTGLGPATFLEGSNGSIFLSTDGESIDGSKSFGIDGGIGGQAMTRSLNHPSDVGEYTF